MTAIFGPAWCISVYIWNITCLLCKPYWWFNQGKNKAQDNRRGRKYILHDGQQRLKHCDNYRAPLAQKFSNRSTVFLGPGSGQRMRTFKSSDFPDVIVHNIEWVTFNIVSSAHIDYLESRLFQISTWGTLSGPLAELSRWQDTQRKGRWIRSAVLVIDSVNRGGTVGFLDVRDKRAKQEGGSSDQGKPPF